VRLTNASWTVHQAAAAQLLGGASVLLVNDLEAVAAALPHLTASDVNRFGEPEEDPPATRARLAFNVGTGCGAALAFLCEGAWRTAPSEAGHMSLAADSAALAGLVPSDATVESVLSGAGVVGLYQRLAGRLGCASSDACDPAAVFSRVGHDEAARATVAALSDVMGRVCGDLVLATAAWGGVYLVGSVTNGWARIADPVRFRTAFEQKGRMRERMRKVPSYVVAREDVALFGLSMIDIPTARRGR
jgi:glucokinase